ncbi:hypothetical protein [Cyprinid herpesvirus 2]|nr:hypothetical protein [Cyprinid herpesvirus 2]
MATILCLLGEYLIVMAFCFGLFRSGGTEVCGGGWCWFNVVCSVVGLLLTRLWSAHNFQLGRTKSLMGFSARNRGRVATVLVLSTVLFCTLCIFSVAFEGHTSTVVPVHEYCFFSCFGGYYSSWVLFGTLTAGFSILMTGLAIENERSEDDATEDTTDTATNLMDIAEGFMEPLHEFIPVPPPVPPPYHCDVGAPPPPYTNVINITFTCQQQPPSYEESYYDDETQT